MEARLDAALRADDGDSYGASVGFDGLGRDHVSRRVVPREPGDAGAMLAALRTNWQRSSREGFDGELNVARWLRRRPRPAAGQRARARVRACPPWIREPAAVTAGAAAGDVGGLRVERIDELFAGVQDQRGAGLTGNEALIRRALAGVARAGSEAMRARRTTDIHRRMSGAASPG